MNRKRIKTRFVCQECGYESLKWQGQCICGAWNSMVEEIMETGGGQAPVRRGKGPQPIAQVESGAQSRFDTGDRELNRVLGGGLVAGSLVLISGGPGIGKSTLLLQIANNIARTYGTVLYVSGEESEEQIKLRAERIDTLHANLLVVSETNLDLITQYMEENKPVFAIIDSIQTVYKSDIGSAPGSVSQVRECTGHILRMAKESNTPVFLVAHVTKQGQIAGPRVLDHMVDCVLFLEGERNHGFRMLRAFKNRFGNTAELALYEMLAEGMFPIDNPSQYLLARHEDAIPGTVVVASVEGALPILVELQALVVENSYGSPPRKVAVGVDRDRLNLITAVLQKRTGVFLGNQDIYVSLLGGVEIQETSIDLGLAVALFSSLRDQAVDSKMVVLGEVDLAGRIRTVPNIERLVKEAERLGFTRCLLPKGNLAKASTAAGMELIGVGFLEEALAYIRDRG
ncbi:MAG: DNA repair protein RadA [Clostridia bacterium]|jgi:DNA repair protein RadA/Sms|nr:DNA repair protein RadA [Clostridia bacterium]